METLESLRTSFDKPDQMKELFKRLQSQYQTISYLLIVIYFFMQMKLLLISETTSYYY